MHYRSSPESPGGLLLPSLFLPLSFVLHRHRPPVHRACRDGERGESPTLLRLDGPRKSSNRSSHSIHLFRRVSRRPESPPFLVAIFRSLSLSLLTFYTAVVFAGFVSHEINLICITSGIYSLNVCAIYTKFLLAALHFWHFLSKNFVSKLFRNTFLMVSQKDFSLQVYLSRKLLGNYWIWILLKN